MRKSKRNLSLRKSFCYIVFAAAAQQRPLTLFGCRSVELYVSPSNRNKVHSKRNYRGSSTCFYLVHEAISIDRGKHYAASLFFFYFAFLFGRRVTIYDPISNQIIYSATSHRPRNCWAHPTTSSTVALN